MSFHFHSDACYGMGPGDTEVLICHLESRRVKRPTIGDLLVQRDELLAALKQINALPSELAGEAWAIARAAIAKAEDAS